MYFASVVFCISILMQFSSSGFAVFGGTKSNARGI